MIYLAPIHEWFIEGFDTLDLREAKALRDALASEAAGTQSLFAGTCQPSHPLVGQVRCSEGVDI